MLWDTGAALNNILKGNLGNAAGNLLGFDATPGYNLTRSGSAYYKGNPSDSGSNSTSSTESEPTVDSKKVGGNAADSGAYDGTAYATGVSSAPAYDTADLAYLQDARARLQRQMDSALKARDNGFTQLSDTYNQEVSGANSDRSRALEDFAVKREDTTRAKDQALTKVDTNARTLAESLRRRIGMASGSGSSAYQITAPGAVARDASQNRTGVVENYGVNFRNLGTAEDRAKSDFEKYLNELESQYKQRKSDFSADVYDQMNQIDTSLSEVARQEALLKGGGYDQVRQAMSPYTNRIDSRQSAIDGLFAKYRTPYSVEKVKVDTPNLRDYMVDTAGIQQAQAGGDQYAPYQLPLQRDKQEDPYAYLGY